MVYKKYVHKRGRKHGPYYYHSYREGSSVKKIYIGGKKEYKKWIKKNKRGGTTSKSYLSGQRSVLEIIPILILLVVAGFFVYQMGITGRVGLNIQDSYVSGENISGDLRISLKHGELLPIDSKLVVEQEGIVDEIFLNELILSNINGSFYVEGADVGGEGGGYGFIGEKITYPEVFFKLQIYDSAEEEPVDEGEDEEVDGKEEQEPEEEPSEELEEEPKEELIEQPEEEIEGESESPITGEAVKEDNLSSLEKKTRLSKEETIIEGVCSKDDNFIYEFGEGETAKIKKNSVKADEIDEKGKVKEKKIGDDAVSLQISDGQVSVSTDYFVVEEGFGEDYLTEDVEYVDINLEELGVQAQQGVLTIRLVYNGAEFAKTSEEISVMGEESPENITVAENVTEVNVSVSMNVTDVNVTTPEITNITCEIIQEIPNITITKNKNYTLNLSSYFSRAENYIVKETENITLILEDNILIIFPEINFTGVGNASILAICRGGFLEQNFFISVIEELPLNITTNQYKAIINKPVKWIKTIKGKDLSEIDPLVLELPKGAENITIKTGDEVQQALDEINEYEQVVDETNRQSLITGEVTGDVSLEIRRSRGILTRFIAWIKKLTLTGNIIYEEEIGGKIIETNESKIVDLEDIVNKTQEADVGVEYYTQAPVAKETNISGGKKVVVSGPEDIEYENILAYSLLDNSVSVNDTGEIRLYWVEEESKIEQQITEQTTQIEGTQNNSLISGQVIEDNIDNLANNISEPSDGGGRREEINFTVYDLDEDGFVDYIEWEVAHLSEQVYEIIYITKAVHLDENRGFVSNIYEEVREKDGNWSEAIPAGHYVRVTFEKPLDKTKDITIYARRGNNSSVIIDGTEVAYDVYEKKKRIEEIQRILFSLADSLSVQFLSEELSIRGLLE